MGDHSRAAGPRLSPLFTWRSAIADSDLAPITRLVAFALSLHMNERGGSAYPSQTTLSHETGLHKDTVREHLRKLRDGGWLIVLTTASRGRAVEYAATVPEGAEKGGVENHTFSEKGGVEGPRGGGVDDHTQDDSKDEDHPAGGTAPGKERPRNLVWEALAEYFRPETPSERSDVGKTERELRAAWAEGGGVREQEDALAAEIRRRLAVWEGPPCRPHQLRSYWSSLGSRADLRSPSDSAVITREAMLARNGPCQTCKGEGSTNDTPFSCPDCGGTGIEGWVA